MVVNFAATFLYKYEYMEHSLPNSNFTEALKCFTRLEIALTILSSL